MHMPARYRSGRLDLMAVDPTHADRAG